MERWPHHLFPGDIVIVATFAFVPSRKITKHKPRLVFVDADNRITFVGAEVPGPERRETMPAKSPLKP